MKATLSGMEVAEISGNVIPDAPPPDPTGNLVTLGATTMLLNPLKGWTSVHQQDRGDSNSKVTLADCCEIQNQHLLGFGASIDVEVRVTNKALTSNVATLTTTAHLGWVVGQKIDVLNMGAPFDGTNLTITAITSTTVSYAKTAANVASQVALFGSIARNWTFMDSTFGYPAKVNGYFSGSTYLCLTACGAPPYMRSPKLGSSPNPMGTPSGTNLTALEAYYPPNWAWFPEYGATIAACIARFPWITHLQVWNENKGFYISTQTSGSNIVPTGSGLVADTTLGGNNNRWWTEGHTAMYNQIYTQCKAVRPALHITGPYPVLNSFAGLTNSADWSNDTFPLNYQGPWGYGDKKVLAHLMYFIRYCVGADSLAVDIRNLQKDSGVTGFYNPASIPAAPDPGNAWLDNPDNGAHGRFWTEGYEEGAWVNGQRQIDFMTWLVALGNSSAVYQRPVCDARTIKVWYAEWYAYSHRDQFKQPNPATGNYYTHPTSTHADETAAFAWQYIYSVITQAECCMAWKPEGSVQGNMVDSGDSNPLALYRDNEPLTGKTLLYTLCKALKDYFPKGTQLYAFTSNMSKVWGLASASRIMFVSRDDQPITFTLVNPLNTTPPTVTLAGYEVLFLAR